MKKACVKDCTVDMASVPKVAGLELVASVDSLVALRAAVDNGADCIELHHRDTADNRHLTGPDFDHSPIGKGIRYAHGKGRRVLCAIEVREAAPDSWRCGRMRLDHAVRCGVDGLVLNDASLLMYATSHYPDLRLHYVWGGGMPDSAALNRLHARFGVTRVILPSQLPFGQLVQLARECKPELQVPGCHRLRFDKLAAASDDEAVNDLCFDAYTESATRMLHLLPQLAAMGVRAIEVEAHATSPLPLAQATRVWRAAIDECLEDGERFSVKPAWIAELTHAIRHVHGM